MTYHVPTYDSTQTLENFTLTRVEETSCVRVHTTERKVLRRTRELKVDIDSHWMGFLYLDK